MNTFHIMKFILDFISAGQCGRLRVEGACSARFEEGVVRFVLSSHCVCARVCPCVPCVSRLPPVSFYRYSSGPFQRILICPLATTRNAPECPARSLPG